MKNRALILFTAILLLVSLACGGGGAGPDAGGGGAGPGAGGGGAGPGAGGGGGGPGPGDGNAGPGAADGNAGPGPTGELPVEGQAADELMTDGALQADENGNVTVSVTDDEVNQILSAQSDTGSQIENAQVTFTSDGIVFSGVVSGQQLTVLFWPYAENGTIQLDIIEATLGGAAVPDAILDEAEASVNASLAEAMSSLPDTVTLQSIAVSDGLLTITARLNA